MIESVVIYCPFCGEGFETSVDLSAGSQSYVENCAVCCRPIEIMLRVDAAGELEQVSTRTDRE